MPLYSRVLALRATLFLAIVATLGGFVTTPSTGLAQQDSDLIKQAKADEEQQNYPAAEDLYRRVLAAEPDNLEALKQLGILEQTDLKFSDSITHFKRVLAAKPEYPQVNFFLGLSYYAQHQYKDAVASFQQEVKTPAAHPATRYYLALALEGEGRNDEAIDQLNEVAAKNPNKADVFFELARLHMGASYHAIDQLKRIDPDSFQLHMLMGEIYSQEAHYEAAIGQYQAALKKRPDAVGIHSPLGLAYWMVNQLEPAKKEFLLAVRESPDDPYANLYLGRMALRDHNLNEALPYLKRSVASHVEEVEGRILLGRCLIGLGELQEAKSDLVTAAGLDPADPRSHYMLADVYQKLNQPADRERELALFNKLSEAQKAKGAGDFGKGAAPSPEGNP